MNDYYLPHLDPLVEHFFFDSTLIEQLDSRVHNLSQYKNCTSTMKKFCSADKTLIRLD